MGGMRPDQLAKNLPYSVIQPLQRMCESGGARLEGAVAVVAYFGCSTYDWIERVTVLGDYQEHAEAVYEEYLYSAQASTTYYRAISEACDALKLKQGQTQGFEDPDFVAK